MVDRVAKALFKNDHLMRDPHPNAHWLNYTDDAITAIKAMREPTDDMISDACAAAYPVDDEEAVEIWQAMVDEALNASRIPVRPASKTD